MARPRTPAGRARQAHARLAEEYPGSVAELCELHHRPHSGAGWPRRHDPVCPEHRQDDQLRDARAVRALLRAVALAGADEVELQQLIRSTGFFNAKARSLLAMARAVAERFDGEIPDRMADLVRLPGVGRKTANVVLSVAFGKPGLPVDTHVLRLSRRLALTEQDDPVKVEQDLNPMVPAAERGLFSSRLILHGRRTCGARKPQCASCVLADFCPLVTAPHEVVRCRSRSSRYRRRWSRRPSRSGRRRA